MRKKHPPDKVVPPQVKALLSAYDPGVHEIALKARALVLEVVPDALEQIDVSAKMLAYGYKATYKDLICVIMPQKGYVNLGFPRGAELADAGKLLVGTGKRARHVKLTDASRVDNPVVRAFLRASMAQLNKDKE